MQTMMEVIKLSGNLDATQANAMRESVMQQLEAGIKRVVLDLHDVSFIDSSGLGTLVMALKAVQAADGQMFLVSLAEQPRLLFELTGVDSVFKVFPDRETLNRELAAMPE